MYRLKTGKKQYYRATPSGGSKISLLWLVCIVLVAAILAGLIVGGILAGKAAASASDGKTHRNLVKFGGVKDPAAKYASVVSVQGVGITTDVMASAGLSDVLKAAEGNGVEICLYDGTTVFYNSAVASGLGMTARSDISLTVLKNTLSQKSKYSVVRFVTSAFSAADAAARAMQRAKEMAILSEIADAGFSEVDIFGLPSDASLCSEVNLYMAEASGMIGDTALFVAVKGDASVSEAATVVSATESYADGFVLDCRGLGGQELSKAIEGGAYYISVYAMRPRISSPDDVSVLRAYGIESYIR